VVTGAGGAIEFLIFRHRECSVAARNTGFRVAVGVRQVRGEGSRAT
jgi:hypothetical protein